MSRMSVASLCHQELNKLARCFPVGLQRLRHLVETDPSLLIGLIGIALRLKKLDISLEDLADIREDLSNRTLSRSTLQRPTRTRSLRSSGL